MTEISETGSMEKGAAVTPDGDIFARKGEASTLGFAVVTGPKVSGPPALLRERVGPRHGMLLSALIALVLSPILVWGTFSVMDRIAEAPLVRVAAPAGPVFPATSLPPSPPKAVAATAILAPDIWVQLHAFDSKEVAAREAARLGKTHADLLNGLRVHVAAMPNTGDKTVYGLRAGAFADAREARDLCDRAQKRQIACVVLPPIVK